MQKLFHTGKSSYKFKVLNRLLIRPKESENMSICPY